ncbi:MAG: cell division protein FtsQ/DivIB [Pseudomonadota bacterium]
MSALNDLLGIVGLSDLRQSKQSGERHADRGARLRGRRSVLRRWLDEREPMRAGRGSALALSFIAAGWLYGAFAGGHGAVLVSGAAAGVGLEASDILITGQVETSEAAIFGALGLGDGLSLVGFSAADARERVLQLPWVKDVAIRKLYPGTLQVALAEKRPMAVWQLNDRLTVVEQSGEKIAKFGIADLIENRFSHLPHLVGDGAAFQADEILPIAARYPQIAGRVKAYIRVANRRWDILFEEGQKVLLPERGVAQAVAKLVAMNEEHRVLDREINTIDLRLGGRVTLRLDEDAAKTRAELVSARAKAMKKADRKL